MDPGSSGTAPKMTYPPSDDDDDEGEGAIGGHERSGF